MTAAAAFIPAPFVAGRAGGLDAAMRELSKLVGQPALRCSLEVTAAGGGEASVAVQVRNIARQACRGVFRVHVFAAATEGGAIVAEETVTTDADGSATATLTGLPAGTVYFHASASLYDSKAASVT